MDGLNVNVASGVSVAVVLNGVQHNNAIMNWRNDELAN